MGDIIVDTEKGLRVFLKTYYRAEPSAHPAGLVQGHRLGYRGPRRKHSVVRHTRQASFRATGWAIVDHVASTRS